MQFVELQKMHGSGMNWDLARKSRKGNLVMIGEMTTGCDDYPGMWQSTGWAYYTQVTAVVHPDTSEVLAVEPYEDDYPY